MKNRHFLAVTLEVTKLTLSKRVVESLYEAPKPLLVSPKHSLTINELTASLGRRYWVMSTSSLPQQVRRWHFSILFFHSQPTSHLPPLQSTCNTHIFVRYACGLRGCACVTYRPLSHLCASAGVGVFERCDWAAANASWGSWAPYCS